MEPDVERRFARLEALIENGFQKSELRFQKAEARMDKAEARSDKLEARFEKRMNGFEKLVTIGMKEIAQLRRSHREMDEKMRRSQRETDEKISALIEAQQRTEASLQRFIDSLGKSTNGH